MGLENVKYDAFISYRHCELDKFNAVNIQKKLESFKLPKSLKGITPSGKTKITRVFRDQDELPLASNLSDPIEDALVNSDWLIVICTPRLKESQWCATEIETFIRLHGRDHVLAVLAEGEPEDSFPEALRFIDETVVDEQGNEHIERVEIEPLAADTRGDSQHERRKQIDDAVIRLAAPIFELNYDDLKQRHKEQRTKRILSVAGSIAAVFFAFAMVCLLLALQISKQKDTIEEQYNKIEERNREILTKDINIQAQSREIEENYKEISAKNDEIMAKNEEIMAKNEEISAQYRAEQVKHAESMADASQELLALGKKKDALYAARSAMPDTMEGLDIPYTASAENALSDALGWADIGNILSPDNVFEPSNCYFNSAALSPDGKYLAILENSGFISVFDTESGELFNRIEVFYDNRYIETVWLCNNKLLILHGREIYLADIFTGSPEFVAEDVLGYVAANSGEFFCTFEEDYFEGMYYLRAYSSEDGALMYDFPALYDNGEYYFFEEARLAIDSSDSTVSCFLSEMANSSGVNDYTLCAVDINARMLFMQENFSVSYPVDFAVDSRAIYIITNPVDYATGNIAGTEIIALDINSGDILWSKYYSDVKFSRMMYINTERPMLLLAESGSVGLFDTYDFTCISYQYIAGNLQSICPVETESKLQYYLVTDNGSILFYDSDTDEFTDYTHTYYKDYSELKVVFSAYYDSTFYFAYDNENYVTQYRLNNHDNILKEKDLSGILNTMSDDLAFDLYGKVTYRHDYRYSIKTQYDSVVGSYRHILYNLETGEQVCSVDDRNYNVMFVKGDLYFATYENCIMLYDYSGNVINKLESEYYFSDESEDHAALAFYNDLEGKYTVVALDNFQTVLEINDTWDNTGLLMSDAAGKAVLIDDSEIFVYEYGNSLPARSMAYNAFNTNDIMLSDDGKYLFICTYSNTVEIYDIDSLSKIKTLFGTSTIIGSVKYLSTPEVYIVSSYTGSCLILNSDFDCVREMNNYLGYDSETDCFIEGNYNSMYLYYIKNISYEELIQQADNILKDYEPSEFIKNRFNM